MQTAVELPEDLLRQAWRRANEEDTTVTALLADGLRMRLDGSHAGSELVAARLLRGAGGVEPWIDSRD